MTRPSHPGRTPPSGDVPFGSRALTAASTSAARTLVETCRIGTVELTSDPNPPYTTTETFTADATDVPCAVEPATDQTATVADDPSTIGTFDVRLPLGTTVEVDRTIEVTAGRNTGLRLTVVEIHNSTTEPLLRVTGERVEGGAA